MKGPGFNPPHLHNFFHAVSLYSRVLSIMFSSLLCSTDVLLIKMIVRSPVNPILPGKFIQLVIHHGISELVL